MASEPFPAEDRDKSNLGTLVASLDLCTEDFNKKINRAIRKVRKLRKELKKVRYLLEDL